MFNRKLSYNYKIFLISYNSHLENNIIFFNAYIYFINFIKFRFYEVVYVVYSTFFLCDTYVTSKIKSHKKKSRYFVFRVISYMTEFEENKNKRITCKW